MDDRENKKLGDNAVNKAFDQELIHKEADSSQENHLEHDMDKQLKEQRLINLSKKIKNVKP